MNPSLYCLTLSLTLHEALTEHFLSFPTHSPLISSNPSLPLRFHCKKWQNTHFPIFISWNRLTVLTSYFTLLPQTFEETPTSLLHSYLLSKSMCPYYSNPKIHLFHQDHLARVLSFNKFHGEWKREWKESAQGRTSFKVWAIQTERNQCFSIFQNMF